jgi:hypothetical protein
MTDFTTIWTIATTVFVALWTILKTIAPYTKTDKDDKIVKVMTQLIKFFSIEAKDRKLVITIKK